MNIPQIPLLTQKKAPRVEGLTGGEREEKKGSPEQGMIYSSACHPYLLLQGNSLPILLVCQNW